MALIEAALRYQRCCVSSPTGSGKSRVIAEYVRGLGVPTIVLVPSINLLHQTHENLAGYLGQPIGRVGDGHRVLEKVTVALPGSLRSLIDGGKHDAYLDGIQAWVIDECHNIAATHVAISARLCNAYARLAVSATVWKGALPGKFMNGGQLLIEAIGGPLVHSVDERTMINNGIILKPQVHVYPTPPVGLPASLQGDYTDWKYNQAYVRCIVNNRLRNERATDLVAEYLSEHTSPIAIIVKRVNTACESKLPSHAELIQQLLLSRHGISLPIIHGKTAGKEMRNVFTSLQDGSLIGCISGPGVFKEGVDIPALGAVMLLTAGSSSIELIQRIGRALRRAPDKKAPIIMDFLDQTSWFNNQSHKRMQTIKEVYGECITIHRD